MVGVGLFIAAVFLFLDGLGVERMLINQFEVRKMRTVEGPNEYGIRAIISVRFDKIRGKDGS